MLTLNTHQDVLNTDTSPRLFERPGTSLTQSRISQIDRQYEFSHDHAIKMMNNKQCDPNALK